jgi:hypothetical protein
MLLEKKYTENDIVSFKLSSGEEVIGKYIKDDMTSFVIKHPLMLVASQKGIGMAPYMFTVDPSKEYTFNKAAVLTHASTDKEIADQYLSQSSGIAIAKTGIV